MKKDIHPQTHPVIFRDVAGKKDFIMYSTLTSEEVEKVDGVDHYVIRLDVSSATHPFFTGSQHLVDTSGRVEKFKAKMAKVEKTAPKKATPPQAANDNKKEEEPKAESGSTEAPAFSRSDRDSADKSSEKEVIEKEEVAA